MFKLVNGSASRRFGVVLADKSSGMMESGASRFCCICLPSLKFSCLGSLEAG